MFDESIKSTFQARAENTFLLALDGDVDFQPEAVIRLVDMMKKNKGVGAACGRIHPTGSGYMPWYQTFEYAVSVSRAKVPDFSFCILTGGTLASESHRAYLGLRLVQVRSRSTLAVDFDQKRKGEKNQLNSFKKPSSETSPGCFSLFRGQAIMDDNVMRRYTKVLRDDTVLLLPLYTGSSPTL